VKRRFIGNLKFDDGLRQTSRALPERASNAMERAGLWSTVFANHFQGTVVSVLNDNRQL